MKKNRKRVTKKAVKQVVLIAIFTAIMTISMLMVFNSINIKLEEEEILAQYRNVSNIDYNVYYKDNSVYSDNYIPKGNTYISGLINKIDVDFSYSLNTNKPGKYNYTYKVVASLRADYQSSGEVWNKDYTLLDNKEYKDVDSVNINEKINIDYLNYLEEIRNYQASVNLDINANLVIKMYIDIEGEYSSFDKKLTESPVLELTIPMTDDVFNITEKVPSIKSNLITNMVKHEMITNIYYFIGGTLLFIVSIVIVIKQLSDFLTYGRVTSNYINVVNKYLKEYDKLIIELKRIPDLTHLNLIEVRSFNELLDAQASLKAPITFAEKIPLEEGWFMIISNGQVYRYILKNR